MNIPLFFTGIQLASKGFDNSSLNLPEKLREIKEKFIKEKQLSEIILKDQ